MKRFFLAGLVLFSACISTAQYKSNLPAGDWVDSVFKSLSKEEKIAQLMVIRAHSNLGADHVSKVAAQIKKYNVGALCFFQGGPVRQANLTNYYQGIAQTPLMITIDGEWGLGMRLDSVTDFPYQLTLGAINDPKIVYEMGRAVGEQCKRLGVHVNYAPVVDVNNNPNNPVIGYRSFGEDKNKVGDLGVAYMKGMQDAGIMACAKHFPGHGDTEVDSHYDLPVINKNRGQLDSLELVPFKKLFDAGIGSVMIAHLYIPSIDNTANTATSLSKKNVTNLLRIDMGYQGLTFTDALEMKGVTKFFPAGEAAVQALIAGNDMLCLPEDVPAAIEAIKKAIKKKRLSWQDIDSKVRKVLIAKYDLGLNKAQFVSTNNLLNELNAKTDAIRYQVARNTITLLRSESATLPVLKNKRVAYVGIGANEPNDFAKRLKQDWNSTHYFFSYKEDQQKANELAAKIRKENYDVVVVGVHNFSLRPSSNYGLSDAAVVLWEKLNGPGTTTIVFGNVLATKNFCGAKNLIAAYQDDNITHEVVADVLGGKGVPRGKLPVTVCDFKYGSGILLNDFTFILPAMRLWAIDSIANDAIARKAMPGCVVLVAREGEIIYHKAFGNYLYEPSREVSLESIYDLASVTKISATTMSVMKLYEQGKLDLKKKLGDYLPFVRGSDKENLTIENILLHQAGLTPFIPFFKETIDSVSGIPNPEIYSMKATPTFSIRVAENLYLRNDWNDTMYQRILQSPLATVPKYVYSDNDFIFLGKVVEAISGMTLDKYVQHTFYKPMGLNTMTFKPREKFSIDRLVPTEEEKHFRRQLITGDVHDEGASMFGGVAGHAGLFSNAYDLSQLYQMLLNGGEFNGERYLNRETIELFTGYHSDISRRAYGFDKPEKDNATRPEPYPSLSASPETFGHTGFTGTCVWVDPKQKLIYIFLSNRVNPTRDNPRLSQLNVRGKIQEAIYRAVGQGFF